MSRPPDLSTDMQRAIAALPQAGQSAALARLRWLAAARPEQITPVDTDWRIWLILAGRGWGKTRTGAEDLAHYALWHPGARLAVVAPTYADARDTCIEGASGLLAAVPPMCLDSWNRSLGELVLCNGSRVKLFSAEEPERLRGPQHHRAWCDELAAWERPETFDQLLFGLRMGQNPQIIVTTTPKPRPLVKALAARADKNPNDVILTRGSTFDNAANLAGTALAQLRERYDGTRMGRQELYAELLEDTPGALWSRGMIERNRVNGAPVALRRVVVAIDPAVSAKEGSDETGLIVAGLGGDGIGYVLADRSGRMTPEQWGSLAVALYRSHKADRIIGEVNNGGDLVEANIRAIDRAASYKAVRASRGKVARAEPVAALYEQGRVKHAGGFPALEDQMCLFAPGYDRQSAGFSPDRVDALVWAVTELMLEGVGDGIIDYYRRLNE